MKQSSFAAGTIAAALSAGLAFAADLPSRKAPAPPPTSPGKPPTHDWSGPSIGLNAGAAIGDAEFADPTPLRGVGFLGGLNLGYDWRLTADIVAGFVADAEYRSEIGGGSNSHGTVSGARGGYVGTFRARLGYAFDRWLAYGTGGLAYGHIIGPTSFAGGNLIGPLYAFGVSRDNLFLPGWTVGGGLQYALTDRLSVKAEYLYVRLQHSFPAYATNVWPLPLGVCNISGLHSARLGVSYGFSLADLLSAN